MLGGGASTVGAVTALHLHAGHRGGEDPQWINFYSDKHFDKHFPGVRNAVSGCVYGESSHGLSPRDKIQAVIHDPSSFYLSVHQLSSQPEHPRPAGLAGKSGGSAEPAPTSSPLVSAPPGDCHHAGRLGGGP
jgi:hypothetical protein